MHKETFNPHTNIEGHKQYKLGVTLMGKANISSEIVSNFVNPHMVCIDFHIMPLCLTGWDGSTVNLLAEGVCEYKVCIPGLVMWSLC